MKPILFNTDMVRAILDGRKTVTRRVVKGYALDHLELDTDGSIIGVYNQDEGYVFPMMDYAPYRPGDILYVRETWAKMECSECSVGEDDCESSVERNGLTIFCDGNMYVYKATDLLPDGYKWRPSIHMPREAARIFLRVKDVRVERLREITEEQAQAEGLYAGWSATETSSMAVTAKQAFMWVWDSTIKLTDRALYGWIANPWVFVISFERISKDEALQ